VRAEKEREKNCLAIKFVTNCFVFCIVCKNDNKVLELRKSKQLAKDSHAVLECDAQCEERRKEKLRHKGEEETSTLTTKPNRKKNATIASSQNNSNNNNSNNNNSNNNNNKNSFVASEVVLYLGAAITALVLMFVIWILRNSAI
jgi:ATP-dependent Zn protease